MGFGQREPTCNAVIAIADFLCRLGDSTSQYHRYTLVLTYSFPTALAIFFAINLDFMGVSVGGVSHVIFNHARQSGGCKEKNILPLIKRLMALTHFARHEGTIIVFR
jgi:hypothetical protein